MSDAFFRISASRARINLGVGSGTHAEQTARVMLAFEPVLEQERPDWVVVVGDVNSTLACSAGRRQAGKEGQARLAHVEAGLRSDDWQMPEEVNRVVTDRLSDLLFLPAATPSRTCAAKASIPRACCRRQRDDRHAALAASTRAGGLIPTGLVFAAMATRSRRSIVRPTSTMEKRCRRS